MTDEQPGLCAESRGPGSLSREEEVEEETIIGVLSVTLFIACSRLVKTGGAEGGGKGGGDVAVRVL